MCWSAWLPFQVFPDWGWKSSFRWLHQLTLRPIPSVPPSSLCSFSQSASTCPKPHSVRREHMDQSTGICRLFSFYSYFTVLAFSDVYVFIEYLYMKLFHIIGGEIWRGHLLHYCHYVQLPQIPSFQSFVAAQPTHQKCTHHRCRAQCIFIN